MIVQTAAQGQPHFVIRQTDHARTSGMLAESFGNAEFAPLSPREPMIFMVAHHDEGWQPVDDQWLLDPQTRLPYHLTKTPILKLIETGGESPTFNEAHHPYSGLISSMHTYGLYHGRYGLSDKVFIDSFPAEHRPAVDRMLAAELERQARLKAVLQEDEKAYFHNYKLLQFFDTLSLYFHITHAEARAESKFLNVPRVVGDDVPLTITPLNTDTYKLAPFPFAGEVEFSTHGKYLSPLPEGADLAQVMAETLDSVQIVRIVL
jgi:hypothetical protein